MPGRNSCCCLSGTGNPTGTGTGTGSVNWRLCERCDTGYAPVHTKVVISGSAPGLDPGCTTGECDEVVGTYVLNPHNFYDCRWNKRFHDLTPSVPLGGGCSSGYYHLQISLGLYLSYSTGFLLHLSIGWYHTTSPYAHMSVSWTHKGTGPGDRYDCFATGTAMTFGQSMRDNVPYGCDDQFLTATVSAA